jgi:hypothetical protein
MTSLPLYHRREKYRGWYIWSKTIPFGRSGQMKGIMAWGGEESPSPTSWKSR